MKKLFYLFIPILVASCGSSSDKQPINNDEFDRSAILINSYDNIIVPAYNHLNNNLSELNIYTEVFITNVNQQNLTDLRNSWQKTYESWQAVEMFDLQKAEQINYSRVSNSYPCIESKIIENINDSITEIASFSSSMLGATGFPAIGYMIYGPDSSNIISLFSGPDASNYKAYLNALVNNLVFNTSLVVEDWSNSRSNFINSTANTQTSSLNIIINDFVRYFEKKVRTAKIGNPIDYFGTQQIRPDQVESYYKSDLCKSLVSEAMLSVKRFYTGESFDGTNNGVGLEDYLIYLGNSDNLISEINYQFNDIDNKINLLEEDFVLELNTVGKNQMIDVFLSMQTLVTYFKIDMMSDRFGISPDYEDNDGDGG